MYNLNEIAGFDSIHTTRLYELIMQFKTTGKIEVTVKDLRFKLGCVDKFKQYYDFKTKTFGHAMEEINQQWTLNIQCEEIKTGKTVTDLVFTFKSTFIRKAYDPVRQKMRSQLIRPRRKTKIEIETKTESTPPPIKPGKKELLKIKETENVISKVKATALKMADVALKVATTPEVYQSIKDGTPILDGAQKTRARREKTVKDTTRKIIDALIKAKNITEEEAKVFAIENGLI